MISKNTDKAYQRMVLSGKWLNLVYPSPADIEAQDIALGLSRHARWNGQTAGDHAYSIARHSLLVRYLASVFYLQGNASLGAKSRGSVECQLYALLHDASEYVMSDLITGFKKEVGDRYAELEENLQQVVYHRFGLSKTLELNIADAVKKADMAAAYYEMHLLNHRPREEAKACFGVPELSHDEWNIVKSFLEPKDHKTDFDEFLNELNSLLTEYARVKVVA